MTDNPAATPDAALQAVGELLAAGKQHGIGVTFKPSDEGWEVEGAGGGGLSSAYDLETAAKAALRPLAKLASSPGENAASEDKNDLGTQVSAAVVANLITVVVVGVSILVLHQYRTVGRNQITLPELGGLLAGVAVYGAIMLIAGLLSWKRTVRVMSLAFLFIGSIAVAIVVLAFVGYAAGLK